MGVCLFSSLSGNLTSNNSCVRSYSYVSSAVRSGLNGYSVSDSLLNHHSGVGVSCLSLLVATAGYHSDAEENSKR